MNAFSSIGLILSFLLAFNLNCGDNTTAGHPVSLASRVRGTPGGKTPFVSKAGWDITLQKAAVGIAGLYYFEGEPAFVRREIRPTAWHRLAAVLLTPIARAHPGHYVSGNALGEMLEASSADLLVENNELPMGDGYSGRYRSGRFVLGEGLRGPAESMLGGHLAIAEGMAKKDGQTVHFRLSASREDVERSAAGGAINGCVFNEADVQQDGTVQVTVDPAVWFGLVDFAGIASGSAEAPTEIAQGETAQIAFSLGLVQLSAYHFEYLEHAP